jgi:hypothetical protein
VLGIDGIGVATLIALLLNPMVCVVLWSARSSFGAGSGAGGGPGPMQPA